MKLTLIRHTRVALPAGICYGSTDVDVAASFEEEAAEVKKGLEGASFDTVYTSPLQRCTKLATFCGFADAIRDNRLRELDFGSWEGLPWQEIEDPLLTAWYDNWMDLQAGGAESFLEQCTRVAYFLDELREKEYRHGCIFAHSGTIRAALVYAGYCTLSRAFDQEVDFGSRRDVVID